MASVIDKLASEQRAFLLRTVMEEARSVVWTPAREEKLLALWKSRLCLLDPNTSASKSERQQAVVEVAAEIGITGSTLALCRVPLH